MKKLQLKKLIRSIIKETVENKITELKLQDALRIITPKQTTTLEDLMKRQWRATSAFQVHGSKQIVIVVSKVVGRFSDDHAWIDMNGNVNGQSIQDFLFGGLREEMSKVQKPEFKRGVTIPFAAVNVGESYMNSRKYYSQIPIGTCFKISSSPTFFKKDSESSAVVLRAGGKGQELKRIPVTRNIIVTPINVENVDEQTSTGAVAGYSTPFAFSKRGSLGSSKAIKAAKKYGTVVKSISEKMNK